MKKTTKLAVSLIASTVLATTASLFIDGIPISGKPKTENVKRVKIEHINYPNETKEFTDKKNIELTLALLGYLRTSPIKRSTDKPMVVKITYDLTDGSRFTVEANSSSALINGKYNTVHDKNTFVKMCTAAFFIKK